MVERERPLSRRHPGARIEIRDGVEVVVLREPRPSHSRKGVVKGSRRPISSSSNLPAIHPPSDMSFDDLTESEQIGVFKTLRALNREILAKDTLSENNETILSESALPSSTTDTSPEQQ